MTDHLFLCGLSQTQRSSYTEGRELQLHGPKQNVRLHLDDIRRPLWEGESDLLTDLAEIATYVFAADTLASRGGEVLLNMGKAWRRTFQLVIAVRQPGAWKEPQRLHALYETLHFLSDDTWAFEFVALENAPRIQMYINFSEAETGWRGTTSIVLFSGGLDSFAGAVHELHSGDQHVVLLSRRIFGMTDGRQSDLAHQLAHLHPRRITHVRVSAGLTDEIRPVEYTQRTRSFLLTAMALVAAKIQGTKFIRFYENGVMSVNLPISTQVVGARASRSTHPRSLLLLQDLCRLLGQGDVVIENPFVWKTKVEVVKGLWEKPEADAIRLTLSCSRTREMTRDQPHCGKCAQCLQRRISILGAGAQEADPAGAYAVDFLLGARQSGRDRAMAIDTVRHALELRNLGDDGLARKFAGELAWLTMSFANLAPDEVVRRFAAMFRQHAEAVCAIFTTAAAKHASDLIEHSLPDSCLLQLIVNFPDLTIGQAPITRAGELVGTMLVSEENSEEGEILLAVDAAAKRIRIDGIAPLTGAGEYRLVSVLVALYREDRAAERAPENYRAMSTADIAAATSTEDGTAARQAISRLRRKIKREFQELYGHILGLDAVIETVQGGKGYRLNPKVRVVAPGQLRRA